MNAEATQKMSGAGDCAIVSLTLFVIGPYFVIFVSAQRVHFPSQISSERNPATEYDGHTQKSGDEIRTHAFRRLNGRSNEPARRKETPVSVA